MSEKAAPPTYSTRPPAGHRIPSFSPTVFEQAGSAPFFDNQFPIYLGSAFYKGGVQPCKISPSLTPPCRLGYGGLEVSHAERFDLLPITNEMEWVPTNHGLIPQGRRAVEGGCEATGQHLFHALVNINGVKVPGKTGSHLKAAHAPYGGREVVVQSGYEILCWRQ